MHPGLQLFQYMVFEPEGSLVKMGLCPGTYGTALLVLSGMEDRQLGHRDHFFMVSIFIDDGLL